MPGTSIDENETVVSETKGTSSFQDDGFGTIPSESQKDDKVKSTEEVVAAWQRSRGEDAPEGEGQESTTDTAEGKEAKPVGEDAASEADTEKVQDLGFDDGLLAEARTLGLSAVDAKAYGSGASLRNAIQAYRSTRTQRTADAKIPAQPIASPTTKPERFELKSRKILDSKTEDGDHEYDKGIRALADDVEGLNAYHQERYEKLLQDQQSDRSRQKSAESQRFLADFDVAVASLQEKFGDIWGKGSSNGLPEGSKEHKNRLAAYEDVQLVSEGYRSSGRMAPSLPALVERSANALFADEVSKTNRDQLLADVKKQSKQHIARPSTRQTSESLSPDEESKKFARQLFRDRGVLVP